MWLPLECQVISSLFNGSNASHSIHFQFVQFCRIRNSHSRKWKWSHSVVSDSATPWTIAHQASPSVGFSRQEYWSGLPLPPPGESSQQYIMAFKPCRPKMYSAALRSMLKWQWETSPEGGNKTKLSRRKEEDGQVFPTVHSLTLIKGKMPTWATSRVCSGVS